ncbi:hypothetical protein SAMN05421827_108116 [Pedobacter terrae]|uniref:Uncharacterized protein n=1 Tax=Pedobacter terrae TaxID=405671 RepID=A0A1G7VJW9_9SPHI|nr:hypothetical protein SAMN05421827_108116 [Pedobacter terrae]
MSAVNNIILAVGRFMLAVDSSMLMRWRTRVACETEIRMHQMHTRHACASKGFDLKLTNYQINSWLLKFNRLTHYHYST